MTGPFRRVIEAVRGPYRWPVAIAGTAVCLVVAAIYVVIWPSDDAAGLAGAHRFVLRWAHPAVWVVLAAACLLFGGRAPAVATRRVAAVGLGLYVAFVVALALA